MDEHVADDPEMKAVVDQYYSNSWLQEVIGTAGEDFSGTQTLGNLITTAYQYQLSANFAIVNNGGIRYSYLGKGEIQRHQIYRIDPFDNPLFRLPINRDELHALILDKFNGEQLSVALAGVHLVVDQINCNSEGIGEIVETSIVDNNLNPVDPSKEYNLIVSEYLIDRIQKPAYRVPEDTGYFSAKTVVHYIKNQGTITPDGGPDLIRRCR